MSADLRSVRESIAHLFAEHKVGVVHGIKRDGTQLGGIHNAVGQHAFIRKTPLVMVRSLYCTGVQNKSAAAGEKQAEKKF